MRRNHKNHIGPHYESVQPGERFIKESILDIKTHYKPTETFQYTHFTSCHPPGVKRGFVKGEAIRLLKTNSSKTTFEECLANFKLRLEARGYPKKYIEISLSEVTFVRHVKVVLTSLNTAFLPISRSRFIQR